MITSGQRDVVIIGASLAGLFAAAAVAAAGARTVIIERDVLPNGAIPRKGVPQGGQAHVLLHRGLLAAEELLPGIREDLLRVVTASARNAPPLTWGRPVSTSVNIMVMRPPITSFIAGGELL